MSRKDLRITVHNKDQAVAMKLPRHEASLTIEHNGHKDMHQSVLEYTENYGDWASFEEKKAAFQSNDMWTVHWYPDTPIGFHAVHASTLEAALSAANAVQEEENNQ